MNALPLERELEFLQLQDKKLQELVNELEYSENNKFELIEGLIYRKSTDRSRFVVPDSMVGNIIRVYHDDMAHCGAEKTYQGIFTQYWFPSMRKRIRDHIDNCIICLMANTGSQAREGQLNEVKTASKPFEIIHVDHFGPLPATNKGSKHVFVVIDSFTRFTWLFATKSTTTKEVRESLAFLFAMFGNPKEIISDRGTAFTSNEFESFVQERNVYHRKIAVASPMGQWSCRAYKSFP